MTQKRAVVKLIIETQDVALWTDIAHKFLELLRQYPPEIEYHIQHVVE